MSDSIEDPAEALLAARAKDVLRGRMRTMRRMLPASACEARSTRLCELLLGLPQLASARTVVGFAAFRKEPDIARALAQLAARGVAIGLPRIEAKGALSLRLHVPGEALVENRFGLREPSASAERIELLHVDAILVPALCFDSRGFRIGYGGGYYDRLLPGLSHAASLGICYEHELLGELPVTRGDVAVAAIVTDARVLEACAAATTL
jgi:5-formyltetrahydrofolate cyclo-ligase